jgi:hypothetical protein
MAREWSAISASRSWMRRARARRLATVAAVSGSPSVRWRSRPQAVTSWRSVIPKPSTEGIGSGDHERVQLALGVAGGLDR